MELEKARHKMAMGMIDGQTFERKEHGFKVQQGRAPLHT
jgi:hypothetical protein